MNKNQNMCDNSNNANNANNDYDCFIRRRGQPWTRGRVYHRQALELFLEMPLSRVEGREPIRISVPHTDGGDFVAWFKRTNVAVCQYRDENDNVVDIMMSSGGYVGFINRVVSSE